MRNTTSYPSFINLFILFTMLIMSVSCGSNRDALAAEEQRQDQVANLLDSVIADGAVTTPSVARKPGISPLYERRMRLIQLSSDAEIQEQLAHPAPHIRAIAVEAMLRRNMHRALDAYMPQVLSDRSALSFIQGDIVREVPMLNYVYAYLLGRELPGRPFPEGADPPDTTYEAPDAWYRQAAALLGGTEYQQQ